MTFGVGHKVALTDSGRDRHRRAAALAIRRHVQREREVDSCGGAPAFVQKSISGAASDADNFEKL